MDTAALEATVSVMDTEQIDEIQINEKSDEINQTDSPAAPDNDALQENTQHQQRQDFTSEMFKIEITNMGKFSFGVRNSIEIPILFDKFLTLYLNYSACLFIIRSFVA